jgi:DHA1 family multidrug resistance protein-like MFS transporter
MTTVDPAATVLPTSYGAILKRQPVLIVIMLTVAGHMLMMGSLAPVVALYAQSFGVTEWAIGMVITVFGIGRLAVDIPAGLIAEKFGRRTLLWVGPAIASVASVGAALTDSYLLLIGFRFFQGVGSGIYMTVATIVCADLCSPETRGRVMALYQAALLTGAGLGPAVGGFVAERFGLAAPFWMSAAIGVVTAIYARFAFTETQSTAHGAHKGGHGIDAILMVIAVTPLAVLLFVQFGVFFSRSAGQWTIMPLLASSRFALSADTIGLAMTVAAVVNMAVLPWAGGASDRFGAVRVITVATLIAATSLFMIAWSSDLWMFWVGMALMGVATGFSGPAIAAYAVEHAPGGRYGPSMGVLRFFGDLGFVVGPVLLGLAVEVMPGNYGAAMALNGGIVALSAVLFLWVVRSGRQRTQPPSSPTPTPEEPPHG